MPKTKTSDPSDVIRANLQDAKDKLASQESDLLSELEKVRKGIASLETTIDLVCSGAAISSNAVASLSIDVPETESTNGTAAAPAKKKAEKAPRKTPGRRGPKPSSAKVSSDSAKASSDSATTTKKTTGKRGPKKGSTRSVKSGRGKGSGRGTPGWKTYMHKEFQDIPLSEAVTTVLNRSPDSVLHSTDILRQIFDVDQMPKLQWTAARDRTLTILSTGVGDNKWYRGKPGHYSVSEAAAQESLSS